MAPKPSIHNFRLNFRPLGFTRPRWQIIHKALFQPGRFSRFRMQKFAEMIKRFKNSQPGKKDEKS